MEPHALAGEVRERAADRRGREREGVAIQHRGDHRGISSPIRVAAMGEQGIRVCPDAGEITGLRNRRSGRDWRGDEREIVHRSESTGRASIRVRACHGKIQRHRFHITSLRSGEPEERVATAIAARHIDTRHGGERAVIEPRCSRNSVGPVGRIAREQGDPENDDPLVRRTAGHVSHLENEIIAPSEIGRVRDVSPRAQHVRPGNRSAPSARRRDRRPVAIAA